MVHSHTQLVELRIPGVPVESLQFLEEITSRLREIIYLALLVDWVMVVLV
jgi:hypothetical protein